MLTDPTSAQPALTSDSSFRLIGPPALQASLPGHATGIPDMSHPTWNSLSCLHCCPSLPFLFHDTTVHRVTSKGGRPCFLLLTHPARHGILPVSPPKCFSNLCCSGQVYTALNETPTSLFHGPSRSLPNPYSVVPGLSV